MRRLLTSRFVSAAAAVGFQRRCCSAEASVEDTVLAAAGEATKGDTTSTTNQATDYTHVTDNFVWSLWNEGNLFSLSAGELQHYLKERNVEPKDDKRRSVLVSQVEDLMTTEQPSVVNESVTEGADSLSNILGNQRIQASGSDLYEEADNYGDWGVDVSWKEGDVPYMEMSNDALQLSSSDPLTPRAYQLLHQGVTGDLTMKKINPSKLPGCKKMTAAYVPSATEIDKCNKERFQKAFEWSVTNLWNVNLSGELNIGAGKVLFWRRLSKNNKNVAPIWNSQSVLHRSHPYAWYAVAARSNKRSAEEFANKHGMKPKPDKKTFKATIKRPGDTLDVELNSRRDPIAVHKPWDRFLVSHYIRNEMPDLRFMVRTRLPIRRKVSEVYMAAEILHNNGTSILHKDLGDVVYACERDIRKWEKKLSSGIVVKMIETLRTPLIVTRRDDEGERYEYELVVSIPAEGEVDDLTAVSGELWDMGIAFAQQLENGMEDLQAQVMSQSAVPHLASRTRQPRRKREKKPYKENDYNAEKGESSSSSSSAPPS